MNVTRICHDVSPPTGGGKIFRTRGGVIWVVFEVPGDFRVLNDSVYQLDVVTRPTRRKVDQVTGRLGKEDT